jgi:indolepyruvate ferredoxin oxidoreductase, beta subunit
MKTDIILSGVGGQGILSIAAVLGEAALSQGLYMKQAEVHGMSQRGGDVQSNLRLSDRPIYSDLISKGKADIVISLEPMEGLRYAGWLSENGWLVSNTTPFINITDYPSVDLIQKSLDSIQRKVMIDIESISKDLGSVKVANMVILGAATPFISCISYEEIENGIRRIFSRKGEEIVKLNLDALAVGKSIAVKK